LKHVNYPLLGDVRYGHGDLNREFRERYSLTRLALHAYWWSAQRPGSEEVVSGLVPLPEDFSGPLANMGFELKDILSCWCAGTRPSARPLVE